MKQIRIVGLNGASSIGNIFVQEKHGYNWDQKTMTYEEFKTMIKNEFPKYYEEYLNARNSEEADYNMMNYFYEYGEDGNNTYIFES